MPSKIILRLAPNTALIQIKFRRYFLLKKRASFPLLQSAWFKPHTIRGRGHPCFKDTANCPSVWLHSFQSWPGSGRV